MTSTQSKPVNPYAKAYRAFLEQTQHHTLTVLHEDGVYRHLRIQAPGTRIWSWDITTWPGHLATSGDVADGYMFTREHDMIGFFASAGKGDEHYYSDGAPSIDVRYWAQKLCGGRSPEVKTYDAELFIHLVRESLEESEELGEEAQVEYERQQALLTRLHEMRGIDDAEKTRLLDAHRNAVSLADSWSHSIELQRSTGALWSTAGLTDDQFDDLIENHSWHELADTQIPLHSPAERREAIIDDARWNSDSERDVHEWLAANEQHVGGDTWEWDLREYDFHFLLTCYCIDLGVRLYREHIARHGANDTYVFVDDGRVQNHPAQPVIDVSFLQYGVPDADSVQDALRARETIMASPQARTDLSETIEQLTEHIATHGDQPARRRLDAALRAENESRELARRRDAERAVRIQEQRKRDDARKESPSS